ncbi:hypothetical protein KCP76_08525 [Salmonella enterica subsp. enterica serovar Weltevreden]|nr:hypothetical protein KCP76_08525 [Salmonella enterica subsp. enterica serovar Weltevreden]
MIVMARLWAACRRNIFAAFPARVEPLPSGVLILAATSDIKTLLIEQGF